MLVDTCGTGGDGKNTFNISTAAAFTAAGAGVTFVKHGNRGATSKCGSADVLEALGIKIDISSERVCEIIDENGIGFMFAQSHHPAMKYAGRVRKEIGIRSFFNLIGPLSNTAGADAQLLGVYDTSLTEKIADVLNILGTKRAMVLHGDGYDEITTTGITHVFEVNDGHVRSYSLDASAFGFPRADAASLFGGILSTMPGSSDRFSRVKKAREEISSSSMPRLQSTLETRQEVSRTGSNLRKDP